MPANVIIQQGGLSGFGVMTDQQTYDAYRAAGAATAAGASNEEAIAAGQRAAGLDASGSASSGFSIGSFFSSIFGGGSNVTGQAGQGFNAQALALLQGDAARSKSRSTAVVLGVVGLLAVGGLVAWQVGKR